MWQKKIVVSILILTFLLVNSFGKNLIESERLTNKSLLFTDKTNAENPDDSWQFSSSFSSTQGKNNWYYLERFGTQYKSMVWDSINNLWKGSQPLCEIAKGWMHPGVEDAVIAWKAPYTGKISIDGNIQRFTSANKVEFRGDGVRIRIMKNEKLIWPSKGWQTISIKPYIGSYQHPNKKYYYGGCSVRSLLITNVVAGDIIYFDVNKRNNCDYDRTEWLPKISYKDMPWFTTDKMEIVMTPNDLKRIGMHTFDGSFGVVKHGKQDYWWCSEWNGTLHYKLYGPLNNPSKKLIFRKNEKYFWEGLDSLNGHAWLTNIYQDTTTGNLIGFVHYEHVYPDNYRIGLAVSKNGGESFKLLGYILKSEDDEKTNGDIGNMLGTPYLVKNGYIYLYYGDLEGNSHFTKPAVARAPLEQVLRAANDYKLSEWSKYYKGHWSEKGIGGKASQLFDSHLRLHGDAAYSTYTKECVLSGYSQDLPVDGVFLSHSTDGINWANSWLVDNSGSGAICPYITIVNADGSDNAVVGKEFYLYWSFNADWGQEGSTPDGNYGLQTLYRQKIILMDKNSTPIPNH